MPGRLGRLPGVAFWVTGGSHAPRFSPVLAFLGTKSLLGSISPLVGEAGIVVPRRVGHGGSRITSSTPTQSDRYVGALCT